MKRSKKIFLILAGIFMLILLLFAYDVSRRTTFPGSKPEATDLPNDTADTTKNTK